MSELARFQDAFSRALAGDDTALGPWLDAGGEAGLTVYRNTTAKGQVDAIVANYPTVESLVGEEWLCAAASAFAREHPPRQPSLLDYGAAFPTWLASFAPASELPYLAQIARIDRLWSEAHLAQDAEPLAPAALSDLTPPTLACTTARLHPSVRLCAFDHNTLSLWLRTRRPPEDDGGFEWRPGFEAAVLARPGGLVTVRRLSAGGFAFLSDLAAGRPLDAAAAHALAAEPEADLPAILSACLQDGLFTNLVPVEETAP